jgi:hypothetical protein
VADRAFVFSNPEIQALLKKSFIPLAMNDWYLRRQEDDVGRFYRKMTEASPRGDAGTATRQGRYVFTAAGKFLGYNNNRSPERILKMLRESLAAWEKLPEAERKAAKPISQAAPDPKYHREPPAGGAIVRVYTRQLQRSADTYSHCPAPQTDELKPTGLEAARDNFWLQKDEFQQLQTPGDFPRAILHRLIRFNTVDNTRGEPPSWKLSEIRSAKLTRGPDGSLEGHFHAETADGARGVKGSFTGEVTFDGQKLAKFRLLALGEHWGDAENTRGARPGKNPIGISYNLIPQPAPADLVAPQFSHWLRGYWQADQE